MNTPSHFIMTAAARKALPKVPMVRSAVWLGSIAPDIPLYLISFGAYVYFTKVLSWTPRAAFNHMYDTLYFEDPWWIGCHNFLHSPVVLVTALLILRAVKKSSDLVNWLQWFCAACLLHAFVDIATHYDDGPVLLWPLSQTLRFYSPISYWDANHFGRQFAVFELIFDAALVAYLLITWRRDAMLSSIETENL